MAIKFDGEIDGIGDHVKSFTASVLSKHGLENSTVFIEPVGKLGDNYTAIVKRFIVETDGKDEKLQMVVKISPTQEILRQVMNIGIIFGNEITIYNELIPKYKSFQKSAGVPEIDRLRFPNCYGTSTEGPGEIVMLEDLTVSGFKILSRFVSLTDHEVTKVVRELGKFHALSFVLKHKDPAFFERITKTLTNVWEMNSDNKEFKEMVKSLEVSAIAVIKNDEYRHYLKGCITKIPNYAKSASAFDRESKFAVILQGDCWTNNIMFKFETGLPREVVLIDYQMGMISSPAMELMYLIFNCTDYETRSKHYYNWLDEYYHSFENFLFYFGLKANYLFSREKLDADLKRYSKISFGTSVLLSSMLVRESDEVVDFREKTQEQLQEMMDNNDTFSTENLKPETQNLFKTKVEGVIKSFIDFGYLTG